VNVLHVPTLCAVHGWSAAGADEALVKLLPLLRARVEAAAGEGGEGPKAGGRGGETEAPLAGAATGAAAASAWVRRYDLGASPLVRDRRTGRSTGKADRVLGGDLDLVAAPPA
jgi:hypothetical protein